jgi:hypothetical protein
VHNARLHAFINEEIERYEYEQKNTYKRSLWNVLENIGK